ncbi:hypothetical protein KBY74_04955 [Cyanobium sp. A1C-AMD]|uniref:hypothetical protein n=1 Tax=Cyanobium sp. A1C-AMD TaxID=2823694 RepID=UPI0020CF3167|nr:hypothetical protein [Cyanobium sp. A1C-AMD]MCP9879213.1 hypothetical protein [Cyanobium sp. A1C-AMD]
MKAETWFKPYGARPEKHLQAKKHGLSEAQKMIGTPVNPVALAAILQKMLF